MKQCVYAVSGLKQYVNAVSGDEAVDGCSESDDAMHL